MDTPHYIRQLNPAQQAAATCTEGPVIVLAGAGSGKTKMITARIAYLIDQLHVPPYQILAVTFTNKAAREMVDRVEKTIPFAGFGRPEIGTFHSVCLKILRRELEATPFQRSFVIYDDSDQLALIKSVLSKLNIDAKTFQPKSFQASINRLKCDAIEPSDFEPSPFNAFEKLLARVYEQYQKDLLTNHAVDFGEIICMTYRLLRDNPQIRKKYQNLYRYVHVDEYQDTNRAQYLLLSTLVGKKSEGHQNICVVGDEDQSIYKWRGADIHNILDFEQDFPGAQTFKLEQNYRSTQSIITAASQVISRNTQRKNKILWTENPEGDPIIRYQFPDERAEAETIVSEIQRQMRDDGMSGDDFAIFYRTHAQSRQFEDVLRREKIPYQVVGGLRFYDRKEIKDILAYLRLILNPSDSVSLLRVINVPARGIGATTIEKLESALAHQAEGNTAPDLWSLISDICHTPGTFTSRVVGKLTGFVEMMKRLIDAQPRLLLTELYHQILEETGYVVDLKREATIEAQARIENLEEFDTVLQEFEETALKDLTEKQMDEARGRLLERFLEQATLETDADRAKEQLSSVKLMTLHGSKGLEFPTVFMVGMEEGLFPSFKPWEETSDEEIEEERRLCYVGMTRAERRLYMSHVVMRRLWGQILYNDPARFFLEISPDLMQLRDLAYRTVPVSASQNVLHLDRYRIERDDEAADTVTGGRLVGLRIQHPDYGAGTIISAEGAGEGQKVLVEFQYRVKRKFLYRFISQFVGG